MKNIEGKNKNQLNAIKGQGEKQLDAIEKENENKSKIMEKDKIMYLENEIDELFEMYSKSFNKQSRTLRETVSKNEYKINYENLSYKIMLLDGTFHEISFFKKYGALFSWLEDLVTRKTTVNSANADQMSFIVNIMHGILIIKAQIGLEKVRSHNIVLAKANDVFLDTKKN